MNRKFALITLLALGSFVASAGVKVTSLDLKTNGPTGSVKISLAGHSQELPDLRVNGKTIEVTLGSAEAFSAISKNVHGAQLSANVLNGKAIIKATLPYDVPASGVNIDLKNNNIEVNFPRGTVTATTAKTAPVARVESDRPVRTAPTPASEVKALDKKATTKVSKEILNEDYLNKLMKDNSAPKTAERTDIANDVIKTKQAAAVRENPAVVTRPVNKTVDNFSFAGYAMKFTIFLAMVLGLFYGVVQLLKKGVFNRGKLGFLNNSQLIEVLSTTYVAPKRSLMIVKAHKQIFLVSNSESGIQFLSEMTDTSGLIKAGEKFVTGTNFDTNLGTAEASTEGPVFKIKENINESTPVKEEKGLASLTAKDIVKFSDELKKKAKKLKPIEFN